MEKIRCNYCKKPFRLLEIVVMSNSGKLFCGGRYAPLDMNSCAYRYCELSNSDKESYFFIKLKDYINDKRLFKK
jgi:hypothetical protein